MENLLTTLKLTLNNFYDFPTEKHMIFEHNIANPLASVGLDPGTRHIGLASIENRYISLWEITIPRGETTGKRVLDIWNVLAERLRDTKIFVIEGASYADKYRQVELQDIRCGATVWAMNQPFQPEVLIVPPNTIRKAVFGSAKVKNPWKSLSIPDNAAAALGCALYPIMKK